MRIAALILATILATACGSSPTAASATAPSLRAGPESGGAATASRLVVEAFSVVEFQYPSAPGHWFYAPLVDVRETGGVSNAVVTSIGVSIPGLADSAAVGFSKCVRAGQRVALLPELYGDYALSYDQDGRRASGRTATIAITFADAGSHASTVTASGPIVSGALPTTYTGGTAAWTCGG